MGRLAQSMSLFLVLVLSAGSPGANPVGSPVDFNRDIRPILSDACYTCHGPDEGQRKAKLRLDTKEGAFRLRDGKAIIVPGKSAQSELYQRLIADASERMPPVKANRQLKPEQIELIRRWIDQGAKWDGHWAFTPPRRPELPKVRDTHWPHNAIDYFILARLEREGLKPAPLAPAETLSRRVTLDLTGLPPTLPEIDNFLNARQGQSARVDPYEQLVDRLLQSPRYGERMALDWLDAARYADSNGYQADGTRTMWPWRDWLIDALNRNIPFDQFTIEMLAGDLLPNATRAQKLATGFHRNHMLNGEGGRIAEESRVDYVVDRVDTTATVWLGLTLGCCRCHNHKYDPFTQKEYYQLYAYFNNVAETGGVDRGGNAAPVMPLPTAEQNAKIESQQKHIADLEKRLQPLPAFPPADRQRWSFGGVAGTVGPIFAAPGKARREYLNVKKQLDDAKKALDNLNRSIVQVMVMEERPTPRDTHLLIRGAYDKYGEKVGPGVITSLAPLPARGPNNRLALARWLVSPENPLTARVTVNRIWQQFFGTGLVKTTEDFGVQGEPPSHPELLDWLATELVRSGWNVKALQKLILMSATYRQSSRVLTELLERDPDNRLLARGPRFRLNSHVLRDQALFLSGLLAEKMGGPPVKPYQPPGLWEDFTFGRLKYVQDKGDALYRRSLYTFWRRTVAPTTMFDTPLRQVCVVRQARTNTPLHSLILLNDVTFVEAARKLAERVMTAAASPEVRIKLLFRLATAREPTGEESRLLRAGLERTLKKYRTEPAAAAKLLAVGEAPRSSRLDAGELAAYAGLASLVLNLDEVMTKE